MEHEENVEHVLSWMKLIGFERSKRIYEVQGSIRKEKERAGRCKKT